MKKELEATFYRERCDRNVLIPMLDKLDPQELSALYHLLQRIIAENKTERRKQAKFGSIGAMTRRYK